MARTLSFRATRVEAEAGDNAVAGASFEIETDGDPSTYFSMMLEDPDVPEVRVSWGDGSDGRDEAVVALASANLARDRFTATFANARASDVGPYGGVDITFGALDEEEASVLGAALGALAHGLGAKLSVALPGVEVEVVKKVPAVPRRTGAPVLGLVSTQPWQAALGETVALTLTLSNLGGSLDKGIHLELAGAALEAGRVDPKKVSASGAEAVFEREGRTAFAHLPGLRVPADYDVDRKADKKAPRPPVLTLTVFVAGASEGSGLFTVRALPAGRNDRSGSAMVGRTFVVGAK